MKINLKAENPISPSRTLGETYTSPPVSYFLSEYFLSEEERLAVIEKYGPPKMPLTTHRSHYLSDKKGGKKNGTQVQSSKDSSGRDRVPKQKRSKPLQGTDAS